MKKFYPVLLSASILALAGFATVCSRTLLVQLVNSDNTAYHGV